MAIHIKLVILWYSLNNSALHGGYIYRNMVTQQLSPNTANRIIIAVLLDGYLFESGSTFFLMPFGKRGQETALHGPSVKAYIGVVLYRSRIPVAQWVKRWSTDLADRVRSPLEAKSYQP